MRTSLSWFFLITLMFFFCGQTSTVSRNRKKIAGDAQARHLLDQSIAFMETDEPDSALVYAQEAISFSKKSKDWETWAKAQTTSIEASYYLGQYREIASTFSDLENTARVRIHADSSFWGDYFNAGGAVYNALGNYESAIEFGLREIAFNTKRKAYTDLAIACNNVGTYYRSKGDFDRALEYTQAALQHFSTEPETLPEDYAWTYGNLSKTWYRKKDYTRSFDFAKKALQILEQQVDDPDPSDFVNYYNDLAIAAVEMQQYETALEYLQRAIAIHNQNDDAAQKPVTLHNLGYVYRMMGRYAEAKTYLDQAIQEYGPQHPNYGKVCRHLGFIAQRQGDFQTALQWQQKSLLALTDTFPYADVLANPAPQRVNSYLDFLFALRDKAETLSLAAEQENRPEYQEAALATYDLAASLLDSMRTEYQEGSQQFWNQEARPLMESAIELSMARYRDTKDQRYLERAFQYAERSKALLLAEALRESAAKQQAGIPEPLLKEEKQLKIDIAFYKTRIFREQQRKTPDTEKILLWQTQILKSRRAYDALLAQLEKSYPDYFQIKYQRPNLSLTAVQKALPAQAGLLEFFTGDRGIHGFYIDRNTARGFYFQPDTVFDVAMESLLAMLRDRERVQEEGRSAAAVTRFAESASVLFQKLVAPAGVELPSQLLVIPDGKLAYLPFELLLTEKKTKDNNQPSFSGLPYLLRKTSVRYEYSAALALSGPVSRKPSQNFTGFAPGYSGDWTALASRGDVQCDEASPADFPALQNNQTEVAQIATLIEGQAFLGEEATEARFRQQAAEPRIVHLAMHGFLNDCDPLYSGLVFSNVLPKVERQTVSSENDGILYAYEIYNLRLNAELAVLSACNTGRGKLAKGEGVISLARAFKYAGCANVLMSLWQADDQATAQIMKAFYQYLKEGMGKDAAIRQAKLDYLDSSNRDHPFFWGAFVLIGDEQPVGRGMNWIWIGLGIMLLVFAGAWYWWKRKRR